MSRTLHHTNRYREDLHGLCQLHWVKMVDFPRHWIKKHWAREVRNDHKQELLRHPDDPVLSHPRRISDPWNWD